MRVNSCVLMFKDRVSIKKHCSGTIDHNRKLVILSNTFMFSREQTLLVLKLLPDFEFFLKPCFSPSLARPHASYMHHGKCLLSGSTWKYKHDACSKNNRRQPAENSHFAEVGTKYFHVTVAQQHVFPHPRCNHLQGDGMPPHEAG